MIQGSGNHHPWRFLKNCRCGTRGRFSGGPDSAGLTVGFDDLKGPIQAHRFYDSVILKLSEIGKVFFFTEVTSG